MSAPTRRSFLHVSSGAAAGVLVAGCRRGGTQEATDAEAKGLEVTATEDLMREHGVLRRALVVYREFAAKLRANAAVPQDPLLRAIQLFRAFGEDYHERKLEEAFIFPTLRRAGGRAASYVDALLAQHQRSREITDYLLGAIQSAKINTRAEDLAQVLDGFARMYETHTAREDTIVFPAWKTIMSASQLAEVGDKFEDIEHEELGQDGFEGALTTIAAIESELGLADVAGFTAPPPPTK
jgi:hemerythrin-like domain-containing protein